MQRFGWWLTGKRKHYKLIQRQQLAYHTRLYRIARLWHDEQRVDRELMNEAWEYVHPPSLAVRKMREKRRMDRDDDAA